MMKSVQFKRYGSSDVMDINQTTPTPNLTTGNVLVEIKAAGINPIDWKIREGYMQQMIQLQFPSTLGMDFSGVIKQVGEGVISSDFKQGDEVYGQAGVTNGGSGAFAELALANVDYIAHKPRHLNHLEAAALPLVGVSAWQALVENIGLKDQKIIIHGGAGGIGSVSIQLAKKLGAYISTTVSANDKQFVETLGADEVIDYKTQAFEDLIHNYDAAYDTVGGGTYTKSFRVLKKGGIIVSMLEQPNAELMQQFGVKAIFQFTQVNQKRLRKLAEFVDRQDNNIKIHIDKTFPLDEARKALDYQKDVHPRGKIVLVTENK